MPQILTSFDPQATPAGGTIRIGSPNPGGHLLVVNESPVFLMLDIPGQGQYLIQAYVTDLIRLVQPTSNAAWTIAASLSATGAPISQVLLSLYGSEEPITGRYPFALNRFQNIGGGTVVTTTTQQINNTNNPEKSPMINGRPSTYAFDAFVATNTGRLSLYGKNPDATSITMLDINPQPPVGIPVLTIGDNKGNSRSLFYGAEYHGGQVFPTQNLIDNVTFYRIDRNLNYYYDAANTRWLTTDEFTLPVSYIIAGPYAAANDYVSFGAFDARYQVYVTALSLAIYLGAINTTGSYWTLKANKLAANNTTSTLASVNTSLDPANAYAQKLFPLNTTAAPTDLGLGIGIAYTGTPSTIVALFWSATYRLIG